MSDEGRPPAELAAELAALRLRVSELAAQAAKRGSEEAALRERAELLRLVFENAFDGISIHEEGLERDSPRRLVDCNERYAELSGRPKAELLAMADTRSLQLAAPRYGAPRSAAEAAAVLAAGQPFRGCFSWIRPDGRENVVEFIAAPVRRGSRVITVGVDRDVTEQAASLERIRRQQAALVQLATSANIAGGGFAAAAAEITETAARALEVARVSIWLGTREEGRVRCIDLYERISGTHSAGLILPMDKYPAYFAALESERIVSAENAPEDPRTGEFGDGYLRPLGIGATLDAPIRVSGQFVGLVTHEHVGPPRPWLADEVRFAGEIADQAAQALHNAYRRDLEARIRETARLESLGLLAGGIAHDFNNLLTGVLGNADLALADLSPDSPALGNLRDIVTAARRAADLCKQLLAYAGKGRFVVEYLDLNDLVCEMTRLLEVSISRKATLRCHLAPQLPAIEADPTQLRQVLMNLITNASEALGEQPGVIAVSTGVVECTHAQLAATHAAAAHLADGLPDGPYVCLEVADTGCGMDEETLARIFDPFFSTKFTGRGLGLAAVLGIVRGHRGTVKVHSEPGEGTTFQVFFPAATALAAPVAEGPRDTDVAGAGRTILLIDDEDSVRLVAERIIERAGFRVLAAADGHEAVELFRQHAADIACVILDLTMPHMGGDETFRELHRIRAEVPVILSSGFNEQDVVRRFAGHGLAGFIQKPYRMADLHSAIRAALARGESGGYEKKRGLPVGKPL